MKILSPLSIVLLLFSISSCDLLEDTDLNPIYFLECEVDGTKFRAQTKNETGLSWFSGPTGDMYTISGQDTPADFNVSLTFFRSLGTGKIATEVNVNSILTSIAYFTDNKTYVTKGGSGCINLDILTDDAAEGTFEASMENLHNPSDKVEITNGKFKVTAN